MEVSEPMSLHVVQTCQRPEVTARRCALQNYSAPGVVTIIEHVQMFTLTLKCSDQAERASDACRVLTGGHHGCCIPNRIP
jgi:hypothetical protein